MTLRRWRDSLAPPLLAVAAIAAVVVPAVAEPSRAGSAHRAGTVPVAKTLGACTGAGVATTASGRFAGTSWYRLDPVLDANGWLTGQRLVAGRIADGAGVEIDLPVEAFASGPRDGRLLVGSDDGRHSTVRLVDIAGRCGTVVHAGPELVRRAILTPESDALVELRLDRETRADLGIWLRPLDGSTSRRIVEPLAPSSRIGTVFSTALQWSSDGRRLAINSCGASACVLRLLDRPSGRLTTVDDENVGELIAVVGDDVVAYGGCPALPCGIVVRSFETGRMRRLAERAGLASVSPDSGGVLAYEDYASSGRLVLVRLSGGVIRSILLAPGARPIPSESRALAGVEAAPGVVPVSGGGRPGAAQAPVSFVDLQDGRIVPAAEMLR